MVELVRLYPGRVNATAIAHAVGLWSPITDRPLVAGLGLIARAVRDAGLTTRRRRAARVDWAGRSGELGGLTAAEAADRLGVSISTVRRQCAEREIKLQPAHRPHAVIVDWLDPALGLATRPALAIARDLGCHVSTVYGARRRLGVIGPVTPFGRRGGKKA